MILKQKEENEIKKQLSQILIVLKGTSTQHSGHMGQKSAVEIYSKCLARAIGKVLLMKFSNNTN